MKKQIIFWTCFLIFYKIVGIMNQFEAICLHSWNKFLKNGQKKDQTPIRIDIWSFFRIKFVLIYLGTSNLSIRIKTPIFMCLSRVSWNFDRFKVTSSNSVFPIAAQMAVGSIWYRSLCKGRWRRRRKKRFLLMRWVIKRALPVPCKTRTKRTKRIERTGTRR